MTVRELIIELMKVHPDTPVVTSGYEGGYDDLDIIEKIHLRLNTNTSWYYGSHERASEPTDDTIEALRVA